MFVVCRKQCQSTTLLCISYTLVQHKHYTSFVELLATNDKSNNYEHVIISNSHVLSDRQTDRQTKSFIYPFVHSITLTVIPIN